MAVTPPGRETRFVLNEVLESEIFELTASQCDSGHYRRDPRGGGHVRGSRCSRAHKSATSRAAAKMSSVTITDGFKAAFRFSGGGWPLVGPEDMGAGPRRSSTAFKYACREKSFESCKD